nr:hypothetical protein [Tanacetum cinerariifolium]
MRLPATHLDEGISTTQPLPEGTNINPNDSKRHKPLVDRDSSTPLVVDLLGTDAQYHVDDSNDDVFEAGDEIDEYIQQAADEEETQAIMEGYYKENVNHISHTDKLVKKTMYRIDKISQVRVDEIAKLLKSLNRVSETHEAESALKEAMQKMTESNNTTSSNITSLTELLKNAKLPKGTDKRNFDVHKPFKFGDFSITDWDELREIIPIKKNNVVENLMNSLRKKYERHRATPEEHGIRSSLPGLGQVLSITSGRKRKHQELEPEVHIPRLDCNKIHPEGVPFVNNLVIELPKNRLFFIDVFGDEAF